MGESTADYTLDGLEKRPVTRSGSGENGPSPLTVVIFMNLNVMLWSKYILEGMFFAGLVGCVSVVLISWVSILKSAFSESSED